jgi:hypothetical protein
VKEEGGKGSLRFRLLKLAVGDLFASATNTIQQQRFRFVQSHRRVLKQNARLKQLNHAPVIRAKRTIRHGRARFDLAVVSTCLLRFRTKGKGAQSCTPL